MYPIEYSPWQIRPSKMRGKADQPAIFQRFDNLTSTPDGDTLGYAELSKYMYVIR